VSSDTALVFLSAYLSSTESQPHLLPNARLEASGPQSGSSKSSVILHNLQRVEAGLKGEWLAPVLDFEEGVEVVEDGDAVEQDAQQTEGEGWQDIDEYQREQSVEGPEVAGEELGVEDDGIVEEDNLVAESTHGAIKSLKKVKAAKVEKSVDPEQRKKEKKARLKAEKQAKEEERKRAAQDA